jgi:hypothetical protein
MLIPAAWSEIEQRILSSTYAGLKIVASQLATSAAGAASLALFDACPSVRLA